VRTSRRWLLIVLLGGLGLLAGTRWLASQVQARQLALVLGSVRGRVIALDPGHGGIDPGAIGVNGLTEDAVNLAVSQRLAALLAQAGAVVVLTRAETTDLAGATPGGPSARKRVDLRARVSTVNLSGADVIVSIHANRFGNPAERGAQTFYNPHRFPQNRLLAEMIQRQLQAITGETRRKISEHIDHYVLNHTDMPGVTVELGFLSNPRDAALLGDPAYQQRIAYAIFVGLAHYFAAVDRAETGVPAASAGV